ncbi:MAG: hypothetical protein ACMUJM_14030 [bacterium]
MIPITISTQPDDLTCGPTSLHAVYNYYNDIISLDKVIKEVAYLEEGGTLGVLLGSHALKRVYRAMIYTYYLKVIDPTWFSMDRAVMIEKLKMQLHYKKGKKFYYSVRVERLLNSILLGIVTYDANLLIIEPKSTHYAKPYRSK